MISADAIAALKFSPRTASVAVPAIAAQIPDVPAAWRVRGLDGYEVYQVDAEVRARKDLGAIADALFGGTAPERAEAVRHVLHLGEQVTPECARQIHYLRVGAVDPALDEAAASEICRCFPVEFKILVNRILELTGQGHEPGKAGASGETPGSEAP